jgi:DMSO/TMAO reductase YedYZ molybdopterin-dependent catalytic subunit
MTMTTPFQAPPVGDGSGLEPDPRLHREELQLAFRNTALALEGLRYDVTPVGMHYTLTHYDIPAVDADAWTLSVGGAVRRPLTLSLADLQRRPARTLRITFECAGDGRALLQPRPISQPWLYGAVGTAEWTGAPLRAVLEEAGLADDAVEVLLTGHDRGVEGGAEQDYQRALPRADAFGDDTLLAWAMNGGPLPPQHGAPVRLVAPGWYGMTNVKWLRAVEALREPFAGYQQATAYRYSQRRDDAGEPVSRMRVRSLLIPPGIPDFLTRRRVVRAGPVELRGRAWSGHGPIARVEVSVDGGAAWSPAEVEAPARPYAWQAWRFAWLATPGAYELRCRATDAGGAVQPSEPFWTARGMGNNEAQRVAVTVLSV